MLFLDEFNRIFNEFVETGSQEIYSAIRESTEKEILDRVQCGLRGVQDNE